MTEAAQQRRSRPLGPAFSNLFGATLASNFADGIARTVVPLLAARITDDAFLIGGVAALSMLPWLLFAIPSGILIDSVDRRHVLAAAQAGRVLLAPLILWLVWTDAMTIGWLYLITFVYGALETLYDGAARAIPPSIVDPADLPRANGRIESGELVTQQFLAGPISSAVFAVSVLAASGLPSVFYLAAGVLALLLPAAASGRQHAHADDARVPWYRQFADGWRFIIGHRMLVILWLVSTASGICLSMATSSAVLFVLGPLGVPEALFGLFMMSGAVGGLAGALLADRAKRVLGFGPAVFAAALLTSVATVLIGVLPNPWVAAACWAATALGITLWNVLIVSLRQALIPGRLLGRVHGTWRTLLWGAMPLGSLLGGLLGRIDLTLPFVVGGTVSTVVTLAAAGFLRRLPNPEDVVAA
ncbi:MAG: MFS transporter [Propionicimonas sp.]|nr:MFS transporter [Propionicimonas sp.]